MPRVLSVLSVLSDGRLGESRVQSIQEAKTVFVGKLTGAAIEAALVVFEVVRHRFDHNPLLTLEPCRTPALLDRSTET